MGLIDSKSTLVQVATSGLMLNMWQAISYDFWNCLKIGAKKRNVLLILFIKTYSYSPGKMTV